MSTGTFYVFYTFERSIHVCYYAICLRRMRRMLVYKQSGPTFEMNVRPNSDNAVISGVLFCAINHYRCKIRTFLIKHAASCNI